MGLTDYGTQTISFAYKEPGKSQNFNKLNYGLFPKGFYSGGLLTYLTSSTVQLSAFNLFIEDAVTKVGIKISTATTVDLTVAEATPFIIIRYTWYNAENNYADVLAVTYGDITSDDIIVGRCAYASSVLQTSFDYTRRTISSLQTLNDDKDYLKVIASEPADNKVYVEAGEIFVNEIPTSFTAQSSPIISATTLGRIDIVYINGSGTLSVLEGADAGSPVQPSFPISSIVLAKITRGASETIVRGDQIINFDRGNVDIARVTSDVEDVASNINQDVKTTAAPDFAGITLGSGTAIGKLTISTSAPSGGTDGDIWFVREA